MAARAAGAARAGRRAVAVGRAASAGRAPPAEGSSQRARFFRSHVCTGVGTQARPSAPRHRLLARSAPGSQAPRHSGLHGSIPRLPGTANRAPTAHTGPPRSGGALHACDAGCWGNGWAGVAGPLHAGAALAIAPPVELGSAGVSSGSYITTCLVSSLAR